MISNQRVTMSQTALTSYINRLTDYQKERLINEIMDFIEFNDAVQGTHYSICPYCGVEEPRIIKKGFLNGKQEFSVNTNLSIPYVN